MSVNKNLIELNEIIIKYKKIKAQLTINNNNDDDGDNKNNDYKKKDDEDAISLNEPIKGIKEQKIYALKNINFTVKEGEFVAIIGDVGSGKSSLIQEAQILILETNQIIEIQIIT